MLLCAWACAPSLQGLEREGKSRRRAPRAGRPQAHGGCSDGAAAVAAGGGRSRGARPACLPPGEAADAAAARGAPPPPLAHEPARGGGVAADWLLLLPPMRSLGCQRQQARLLADVAPGGQSRPPPATPPPTPIPSPLPMRTSGPPKHTPSPPHAQHAKQVSLRRPHVGHPVHPDPDPDRLRGAPCVENVCIPIADDLALLGDLSREGRAGRKESQSGVRTAGRRRAEGGAQH